MSDKDKPGKGTDDDIPEVLRDLFKKLGGSSMKIPGMEGMPGFSPDSEPEEPGEPEADPVDAVFDFRHTPREVKEHLDRFVIRQDEAKKALSIAVCDHYNHAKYLRSIEKEDGSLPQGVEFQKQNVMVVGPTGVGKTYLIKHVAELMGVPFVKADATKFSETGYVGGDVDDLVRELVKRANGDVALAEYGIIYIDEIDKLAGRGGVSGGRDVSGRGVQTTLLKLMEETEVQVHNPMDMRGQMQAMMQMQRGGGGGRQKDTINTRHILFIVSGAFSGLEKLIDARTRSARMGFQADTSSVELDEKTFAAATTQDFIDYGFEAEFIGRLPVRVVCESLTAADFVKIMHESEGSILRQYEREFEAYGIQARFADDAIEYVAELAEHEKTGARALMTVCERLLREFKYELPSSPVTELNITRDLLENPEEKIESYRRMARSVDMTRARDEAERFAREFSEKHGVGITFTADAVEKLAEIAGEQARSVLQLCRQRFSDFEFGLKLLQKNTGEDSFELPAAAVDDPDNYLSSRVVAAYRPAGAASEEG